MNYTCACRYICKYALAQEKQTCWCKCKTFPANFPCARSQAYGIKLPALQIHPKQNIARTETEAFRVTPV